MQDAALQVPTFKRMTHFICKRDGPDVSACPSATVTMHASGTCMHQPGASTMCHAPGLPLQC